MATRCWAPSAFVVIGGLVVAGVLTLIFPPALYVLWFRRSAEHPAAPASPEKIQPAAGFA